jgi:electron transfer flavoprotein beta subunit
MGPPQVEAALREALSVGADEAILLSDRAFAGADTWSTSLTLALALKKCNADLILCGKQAIDGDTAQVPPQTAEKLGWPQVTYVEQVEAIEARTIRCRRNTGAGWERVECRLPCLLTVTDQGPEPRPEAAKRVMAVKKHRAPCEVERDVAAEMPDAKADAVAAEAARRLADLENRGRLIEQWSLDDFEVDLAWCGRDGSPTKVKRIQSVVLKGTGFKSVEPTEQGIAGMVHELIEDRTLG